MGKVCKPVRDGFRSLSKFRLESEMNITRKLSLCSSEILWWVEHFKSNPQTIVKTLSLLSFFLDKALYWFKYLTTLRGRNFIWLLFENCWLKIYCTYETHILRIWRHTRFCVRRILFVILTKSVLSFFESSSSLN